MNVFQESLVLKWPLSTYVSKMSPRMLILSQSSPSKCLFLDEIRHFQKNIGCATYSMHYVCDISICWCKSVRAFCRF